MRLLRLIAGLMLAGAHVLVAQPVALPWSVADGGGGKSAGTGMLLSASVGQAAAGAMSAVSMGLEGGYIPGIRNLGGTTATFTQSAASAWNMISVPLIVPDYQKTTLYPDAASPAFSFTNTYVPQAVLENGLGYWLQYTSPAAVAMSGTTFQQETLDVAPGWNLVGGSSYPVLKVDVTPIGTSITSNFFAYLGSSYVVSDTLQPGNAYWIQVSVAGKLVVNSGYAVLAASHTVMAVEEVGDRASGKKGTSLLSPQQLREVENFNRLSVRETGGIERVLFFSSEHADLDLTTYALPPLAPGGNLDVRFASQRIVEVERTGKKTNEFPIQVDGGKYPLTLSWDISSGKENGTLVVRSPEGKQKRYPLEGSGSVTFPDEESAQGIKLVLNSESKKELPKEFALFQNYPNPFNPSTQIRFDLPKNSHVSLIIYNLLGVEVQRLVDEERDAGAYAVEFDATKFASGVYFYRLEAGEISFTKKLMLVR